MELQKEEVAYWKVQASDLEAFIENYLGSSYSVEADLIMGHDELREITVTKGIMSEVDKNEFNETREHGSLQDCSTGDILNYLCDLGWLDEGDYLIETC